MIDFKSTLKMATTSLRINKMRSALTSLGIIIGVSAVIIMLGIGTGASKKVQANMESMGSNILTVRSSSVKAGGVQQGFGSKPSLTLKDALEIAKTADNVDAVAVASNESKQLMYGNQNWATSVYGVSNSYLYIKNYEVESGRDFQTEDSRNYAKVAIIGSTVATELFGDLDPIGRVMRIGNVPFKIIGTLKTKGSSGPMDQDDLVFIPITTAQRKVFGTDFPGSVKMILVKGEDADKLTMILNTFCAELSKKDEDVRLIKYLRNIDILKDLKDSIFKETQMNGIEINLLLDILISICEENYVYSYSDIFKVQNVKELLCS